MTRIAILMTAVLFSFGAVAADGTFTKAQEAEIKRIIGEYMEEKPEIVMQALETLQRRSVAEREAAARQAIKEHAKDLFNSKDTPFIGNAKGDIVIVEFFDYNCGYCKAMFETMFKKVQADKRIKWVLKELPTLSNDSMDVSRVALAVHKQGKYEEFHRRMMTHKGLANKKAALDIAKDMKLDMDRLEKDMAGKEVENILNRNREIAVKIDASAVPTFIFGENLVLGAFDEKELNRHIEDYTPVVTK